MVVVSDNILALYKALSILILTSVSPSSCFQHNTLFITNKNDNSFSTRLFGITEWRQQQQQEQNQSSKNNNKNNHYDDCKKLPLLLLLPFAASEALVPGQTRNIVLKEGRFFDLFQDAIDEHHSILGMVLMGDDGLLKEMPLCEILDFDVHSGFRGKVTLSVTLKAVGRAQVKQIHQMKPIMIGTCKEIVLNDDDDIIMESSSTSFNTQLKSANELLNDIELIIQDLKPINGTSRMFLYEKAYVNVIETLQVKKNASINKNDDNNNNDNTNTAKNLKEKAKTIGEINASCWAALTVLLDQSKLHMAISSTNLVDRLKLALQLLLEEKYKSNSNNSTQLLFMKQRMDDDNVPMGEFE